MPKKTVHAIAHFDFDGSCLDCPCAWWSDEVADGKCQLNDTEIRYEKQFGKSIGRGGLDKGRHEHCPLCVEED